MEAAVSQVTTAFSKPEDESTWTAMDKSLAFFTVSIQKVSPLVGVEALKRITKHITQSLLSPRSALQKTAITLLSTSASSLGPSFASQGMATEHLTSLLQLSAKASAVMVRLAWSGIASIVSDVGGTGMYPFAVLCCSELRKGSKASKPLRIICVDSVCCILEALRSNLVDGGRFIEVVQEVLRLAISDSANEVRDAGRRLFGEYSQLYTNQVDKFTSSLTPQHMKSLQIKPPPTVKPASNNSRDNNQETNSAKQLVREKQEQE
ncbi:hypothetical protein BDR26DRAFT_652354 [Obelidium mucronatum]|nr:hypothetical protein BDR26DRAFT_652354 [Obelidium mucronatum]